MEIVIYGFVFITSFLLLCLLNAYFFGTKQQVDHRLERIRELADTGNSEDSAMMEPFTKRVLDPLYDKLMDYIHQATPAAVKNNYTQLLNQSGLHQKMGYSNVVTIQLLLSLFLMGLLTAASWGNLLIRENFQLFLLLAFVYGCLVPYLLIRSRAEKRKEKIQQELPTMLDLIYVSVEAGLSFDMAIKRTTQRMAGPLSEEMQHMMAEMNKGKDRAEAMRELYRRLRIDDLKSFVTAVIQAEELGSNIGNVLRIQSETMRISRRQRAQERAAKIPTKMLFPLIFLMFPALFVVILGPALINIMNALS